MTQDVLRFLRPRQGKSPKEEAELQQRIRNHRVALMEVQAHFPKVDESIIQVGELSGSRIAETFGGRLVVDPVAFKSVGELSAIYAHEGAHLDGIHSEGLTQKRIADLGIPGVKERAEQDYSAERTQVEEVTKRLGTDRAVQLYKANKFTDLLGIFRRICANEGMTAQDSDKLFFTAFPELEFEKPKEEAQAA